MDNFEDKLASVMNNPEMMEKIIESDDLVLFSAVDKEGKKEIKKLKKQLKDEKNEIYSYCHEIFPKQYTFLKLDDGESVSYLKFTPNQKMLKIIEK